MSLLALHRSVMSTQAPPMKMDTIRPSPLFGKVGYVAASTAGPRNPVEDTATSSKYKLGWLAWLPPHPNRTSLILPADPNADVLSVRVSVKVALSYEPVA